MKESCQYPNPICFTQLMLMAKKKNQESYSLLQTGKSPSFDFFLFDMNCYLKELCQINNYVK